MNVDRPIQPRAAYGRPIRIELIGAAKGQRLTWDDVAMDTTTRAWQLRQALEAAFR